MTRTPTPQLSHADRRAQLDALMANYTGPITHITAVKLSSSGARRLNRPRQSRVLEVRAARGRLSDKGPCRSRASCYGNRAEGNYYLTLAPASAAGAILFSESRQPGPHDSCVGTLVLRLCWRDDRSKQTSFAGSRS
jgi:hypothetical protein